MTKNNMITVAVPKSASENANEQSSQHKFIASSADNGMNDVKEETGEGDRETGLHRAAIDDILSKIKPSSFGQKRLYSSINISADKWLLSLDENSIAKLENPPSLADGLDRKTEQDLRYLGCEIIQSGAILLRIPQVAAATAQILYQRFYYQRSFVRHHFEYTVMACLLLASKIEEAPRRPRDVINVFHRLEHLHGKRNESKKYVPMLLDRNYVDLKNQVIKAERKLLNALGFVVHVNHPHKLIYAYLHALGATGNHELMQRAWSYMNDGLRTDIFLRYRPETIACACIHLAARTISEPVPLPRDPFYWFEVFDASDRDVKTISYLLLQVYTRIRAPNWTRLNDILNKLRSGLNSAFAKTQRTESLANKEEERARAVLEKKRREIANKAAEMERRQNGTAKSKAKEGNMREKEIHHEREKENDRYNAKQSSSSASRSRSRSPIEPKKFRSSPGYHRRGSLERERPSKRNHHHSRHQRNERRREREERRAEKDRRHRTRSRDDRRKAAEKDRVSNQREREKDVYLALGKRRRSSESLSPVKVRR